VAGPPGPARSRIPDREATRSFRDHNVADRLKWQASGGFSLDGRNKAWRATAAARRARALNGS
jgi:hypothetical protein